MSHFEIKTDLPMPPGYSRGGRRIEYPLADLQVGQCILVPEPSRATLANRVKIFVQANPGWTFRGHAIKETKQHGFWCTARPDAPAVAPTPPAKIIRRESEVISTSSSPTAHQQKLREAAKLQPIGKRTAHLAR